MLFGKQQCITRKKHELGKLSKLSELGEPVKLDELSELGELDVLGELGNSKPRNLKKNLCIKQAYCRTATCKTCKFRPLSDRPTVETDVQNRRCTTSIYIASFQIDFRFRTSKS